MPEPLHPPIAAPLGDVTTERLLLERICPRHHAGLAEVFAKPEVWEFPLGRAYTPEETARFLAGQTQAWEDNGFGLWVATEQATERVVGYVGISVPTFLPEILPAVEVGWRFDPDVWGRGYATEGARAALRESFTTLGLDRVSSVPQAGNDASSRVADRVGMTLERTVTIPANEHRGELQALLYWMTSAEWAALA
jgi:RimJ/RimL family protein N-acetyltransferase